MVGITLSPEQIRAAPAEVRRWLEHELAVSLGLRGADEPQAQSSSPHLVAFSVEEAGAVLSLIQGMLPAVNVFFELGREGSSLGMQGIRGFRLVDIMRHTRLQTLDQVVACLEAISAAVRRVRGDADASFYGLNSQGICIIAEQTQRSILRIWQQIVAAQGLRGAASGIPPQQGPGVQSAGIQANAAEPGPFATADVSAALSPGAQNFGPPGGAGAGLAGPGLDGQGAGPG